MFRKRKWYILILILLLGHSEKPLKGSTFWILLGVWVSKGLEQQSYLPRCLQSALLKAIWGFPNIGIEVLIMEEGSYYFGVFIKGPLFS